MVTAKERLAAFELPPAIYGECSCGAMFHDREDYEIKTIHLGYQERVGNKRPMELRNCRECGTTLARAI